MHGANNGAMQNGKRIRQRRRKQWRSWWSDGRACGSISCSGCFRGWRSAVGRRDRARMRFAGRAARSAARGAGGRIRARHCGLCVLLHSVSCERGLGGEGGAAGLERLVVLTPHRRRIGEKRSRFSNFFSGWVGCASAKAGCDASENTGARSPCQGVEGPFLHFPHFSHNLHFGLLPAEPAFRPLDNPDFAPTFLLAAPRFHRE